jgi:hypothetical protein
MMLELQKLRQWRGRTTSARRFSIGFQKSGLTLDNRKPLAILLAQQGQTRRR